MFVRWDPPERLPTTIDGVVYRVECRPAGENDAFAKWNVNQIFFFFYLIILFFIFFKQIISNHVENECVLIKHLAPLSIYQFRVSAKNNSGWSNPSITSRIIQTHPRGNKL